MKETCEHSGIELKLSDSYKAYKMFEEKFNKLEDTVNLWIEVNKIQIPRLNLLEMQVKELQTNKITVTNLPIKEKPPIGKEVLLLKVDGAVIEGFWNGEYYHRVRPRGDFFHESLLKDWRDLPKKEKTTNLSFSEALELMNERKKVTRSSWKDTTLNFTHIYLREGFFVRNDSLLGSRPFYLNEEDLLATDWSVVE